jgi:uncharacterized lipoprotein NlpE involved in copper resistance
MKKYLAVFLVFVLVLSLIGCGKEEENSRSFARAEDDVAAGGEVRSECVDSGTIGESRRRIRQTRVIAKCREQGPFVQSLL